MKHQTIESHFHTPGVGQTRFAAAIDILKNKSWYVAPRSSSPVYCAVCGKKIRLSAEKRKRVTNEFDCMFFLPAFILALIGCIDTTPICLIMSVILQILRPILAKRMTFIGTAFVSWEDEDSFKRRLSQQNEEKGTPWYMKYLSVKVLVASILALFIVLLEY